MRAGRRAKLISFSGSYAVQVYWMRNATRCRETCRYTLYIGAIGVFAASAAIYGALCAAAWLLMTTSAHRS